MYLSIFSLSFSPNFQIMPLGNTQKLERQVATLTLRSEAIAIQRAAWGIYSLLSIWKLDGVTQKIALPSFLCQSPLASIVLAGWEPEFCDVDPNTGNVSNSEWQRVIELGVDAILFVHLFGYIQDAGRIAAICKSKGIYFIEDACQSFGGEMIGIPCGTSGDAAIISFGHTKTIDFGQGGMILTNDLLLSKEIRNFQYYDLRMRTPNISVAASEYRRLFYAARDHLGKNPELARKSFKGLLRIYEPLIFTAWDPGIAEAISNQIDNLDILVRHRREKAEHYKSFLKDTALKPLEMSQGSVPWRVTFRLPGIGWDEQDLISEAVREEGIDISSWYIPSHWLMADDDSVSKTLDLTESLSREVFQLWVDERVDNEKIERTSTVLTNKLKVLGYA